MVVSEKGNASQRIRSTANIVSLLVFVLLLPSNPIIKHTFPKRILLLNISHPTSKHTDSKHTEVTGCCVMTFEVTPLGFIFHHVFLFIYFCFFILFIMDYFG